MGRVVRNPRFKAEMGRAENARAWQEAAAAIGTSALQAAAPKETGFLTARIEADPHPTEARVRFRANVGQPPYGLFQEVGTGLYGPLRRWITPRRARMLSWVDSNTGLRRFARRVRGTAPKRYFRTAMTAVFARVNYYGETGGRGPQQG